MKELSTSPLGDYATYVLDMWASLQYQRTRFEWHCKLQADHSKYLQMIIPSHSSYEQAGFRELSSTHLDTKKSFKAQEMALRLALMFAL